MGTPGRLASAFFFFVFVIAWDAGKLSQARRRSGSCDEAEAATTELSSWAGAHEKDSTEADGPRWAQNDCGIMSFAHQGVEFAKTADECLE